jgi:hypothetical protein
MSEAVFNENKGFEVVGVRVCGKHEGMSVADLTSQAKSKDVTYTECNLDFSFGDNTEVKAVVVFEKIVIAMELLLKALENKQRVYLFCRAGEVRSVLVSICLFHIFGFNFAAAFSFLLCNGRPCHKLLGLGMSHQAMSNFINVADAIASMCGLEVSSASIVPTDSDTSDRRSKRKRE